MNQTTPYISSGIFRKDPNDTALMMNRCNVAKESDRDNRVRGIRNMGAYLNDLLPGYLKNALYKENRIEQNFGILLPIIRGHVGNVLMNWFDPKFNGRDGVPVDAVESLYKVYVQQKEYYNYKASATSCYENGYVYRGVEQLILDRPTSNPRSWGSMFVSMRPDRVVFDQNSDGDNISRGSQEAWIFHHMSPSKVIRLFGMPGNSTERDILWKLQKDAKENPRFEAPTIALYDTIDQKKFGSNMFIVEWLHIEYEKKIVQYLMNGTPLPDSGYEIGTIQDVMAKKAWADQYGFQLSDDMILTMTDNLPMMYTTTFAPDEAIMLEDRKDFRQLNGHLPLYAWSFMQKNGLSLGVVDFEWDIIQDFNKNQLHKTKIRTKTAIAGKQYLRRDMFGDDKAAFDEALQNYTDSSIPLVIPELAPPVPTGFGTIPGAQFPPSLLQDDSFMIGLSERVGMLPPILQGRSEKSADSGVSLGRKSIEANVMMKQESTSIVQHENDKHEDWVILNIKLLGSFININRKFTSADGKDQTIINEVVGIDSVGNTVMRNQIASLKDRINVIISQTKENDFVQQARLEKSVASLQAMQPTDTNVLTRAAIEYNVATSLDFSTDEERELITRLAKKQLEIVDKTGDVQLLNLNSQLHPQPQAPVAGGMPGEAQPPMQNPLEQPQTQLVGAPVTEGAMA
jgi:hypothetical protein